MGGSQESLPLSQASPPAVAAATAVVGALAASPLPDHTDHDDPWGFLPALSWSSLLREPLAGFELLELLMSPVYLGVGVPRGDGSPVLCLPGFLGSDSYLGILRGWLRSLGYRPYPSDFVIAAVGSPFALIERTLRRTEHIATTTNQRLTVIGHSLGGLIAHTVARFRPDLIAHVVTLGSAVGPDPRGATHPLVRAVSDLLLRESRRPAGIRTERALVRMLFCAPVPGSVRLTCIYSREDAVVDWRACPETAARTTIYAAHGTHTGLAWNAAVYRLLGEVLASRATVDAPAPSTS
jgi:triacylglycerol lipase